MLPPFIYFFDVIKNDIDQILLNSPILILVSIIRSITIAIINL